MVVDLSLLFVDIAGGGKTDLQRRRLQDFQNLVRDKFIKLLPRKTLASIRSEIDDSGSAVVPHDRRFTRIGDCHSAPALAAVDDAREQALTASRRPLTSDQNGFLEFAAGSVGIALR